MILSLGCFGCSLVAVARFPDPQPCTSKQFPSVLAAHWPLDMADPRGMPPPPSQSSNRFGGGGLDSGSGSGRGRPLPFGQGNQTQNRFNSGSGGIGGGGPPVIRPIPSARAPSRGRPTMSTVMPTTKGSTLMPM